jgi:hypothetical protein
MSDDTTPDPKTDTEKAEKAALSSETVRPPDSLRDAKSNPLRAGFREKANTGSKAQSKKRKK